MSAAHTKPKIDFKKTLKHLYKPKTQDWTLIEVPRLQYLMIDGHGAPEGAKYTASIEILYSIAYKLKFLSKNVFGQDYVVPPLEGLWWADDWSVFTRRDKASWCWTMMIMQPEWLDASHLEQVREVIRAKKPLAELDNVRSEFLEEGLCMQKLHIGSYEDETEPLRFLHQELIPEQGLREEGKHHEIYISDPRKVAAEKLKTILRQPVRRLMDSDDGAHEQK